MANKYVLIDWIAIDKLLASDDISELIKEKNEFVKELDNRLYARYKTREALKKHQANVAKKQVTVGGSLWYIGNSKEIPFGSECIKIADRRKYMEGRANNKNWTIPYDSLSINPPTPEQITSQKIKVKLGNIL